MSVESMINAGVVQRYIDAVTIQGPGFVDLRTPPRSLPVDDRGLHAPPPAELFGADRHPWTAGVLDGSTRITWGWP